MDIGPGVSADRPVPCRLIEASEAVDVMGIRGSPPSYLIACIEYLKLSLNGHGIVHIRPVGIFIGQEWYRPAIPDFDSVIVAYISPSADSAIWPAAHPEGMIEHV